MKQLRNIVVATDFSPLADAAIARAASLARLSGAALHVVHAIAVPLLANPYEFSVPADLWESLRRAAQEKLEQTRKTIEAMGVASVTAQASDVPDPIAAISDAVAAHGADLVVMGTHGRSGLKRAFLGSVTERALRTLDCPILVVRDDPASAAKPIEKVLLAVDFSPHSDQAIAATASLAAQLSASVDVVHAFELTRDYNPYLSPTDAELARKIEAGISRRLEDVRDQLEKRGIAVRVHFLHGHPDVAVADAARELGSQLIVMGARGRSGLAHVLLGSVAERTLRAAPCSVLCVKAA